MRVLFWNINGVARDAAQCKLKELFREFKPNVFCLSESKVHYSVAFGNRLQLEGFSSHVTHNATANSIDNLWVCYLDSIRPSILNRSKQAISIEVDGGTCILILDEKKGGLEPRTSAKNEFSDWLDENNLFESNSLGTKFTWTNSQSGTNRIIIKLDRVVINAAWLAKFDNWRCKALTREVFDHSTLLGYPFVVPRPKRAPFCIQKMWFLHDDFLRMVSERWNMPAHGSLDFIFTYKLKRLKWVIKKWNLMVFGNVHSRLKQDQLRFETAALCSDEDPNDVTKLNAMKDAMAKLSETRLQHNTMLKQKERNQWLVEGSSNSTFFHNSIRIRRSSNTISELVDRDDHTISDYDLLRDHIMQFYEEKFNGQETVIDASLFDYDHVSIS
ncbi:uncharacterized protein LOC113316067 [Papaver somniferum]|uniref:uncharacterized protein LOC113316067 n=1 Tax=Papaver somniferum TaxID=3469 RepID=UPI000E6F47C2|nr:uncharacterized protein LOC113316067 [Papaver somniferum]